MRSRPTRLRFQIAILAGMLLLLTAVAAASAVPAGSDILRSADVDRSGAMNLGAGERHALDLSFASLTPGETVRARQVLANVESQAVRYSLASVSSDEDGTGVRDILRVTIKTADPGWDGDGDCSAFDGVTVYDGRLGADAAGFGSARMGAQPGDRLIVPGGRETLCFEMRMTLAAGNRDQGAATRTGWTIATEQVAGNP